jgi:hypothetical protein
LRNWEAAKRDVKKDLRSPAFKKELWTVADEIERQIFGPEVGGT